MKIHYLNTVMQLPKHAGKTFKQVIDEDIAYVKWLHRNRLIAFDGAAFDYFLIKTGSLKKGFKRA